MRTQRNMFQTATKKKDKSSEKDLNETKTRNVENNGHEDANQTRRRMDGYSENSHRVI